VVDVAHCSRGEDQQLLPTVGVRTTIRLETATLQGSDARLIRCYELHRRISSIHLPAVQLPPRAMLLGQSARSTLRSMHPPISSRTWPKRLPDLVWSWLGSGSARRRVRGRVVRVEGTLGPRAGVKH
jgi:hypothetical protein